MDITLINQLLCSTIKIDNRTQYYGNANVVDITLLSTIYEITDPCCADIEYGCLVKLSNLVDKIIHRNKDICFVRGNDIFFGSSSDETIPILIDPNTAPTVDDNAITTSLLTYTFNSDQFKLNFTDTEGDSPYLVRIVSLPASGTLKYAGLTISAGFLFDISNASNLTYTRVDDPYITTFNFQTSDDNLTNKLFSNMATFTLNVAGQINQPPTVGNGSTSTAYNTTVVFTTAMFTTGTTPAYSDPEGDAAETLKILSLPSSGTLYLDGIAVSINDEIDFTDITAGLFTYVPDAGTTTAHAPTFTFQIKDAGSGQFAG